MSARISGTVRVQERVFLDTTEGAFQIIIFPLHATIPFPEMVERSIQAFQPLQGERVTLEGELFGGLLTAATVVSETEPSSSLVEGLFKGRLESQSGQVLHVDVRVQNQPRVISADYFRDGSYFCSMRAQLVEEHGVFESRSPRFIFDGQTFSQIGGDIQLEVMNPQSFQISSTIPGALPERFQGMVSFHSQFFRVLNIEVDKLHGMPWPPEFSTSDIPNDQQPLTIDTFNPSVSSLFRRAGIDARVHHNDGALGTQIGQQAGRPGEEDRWDEREMHEMMDTQYSRNLSDREWWLYCLIIPRFDGGPARNRQTGQFIFENGQIRNDGVGTTGIIFDSRVGNVRDPWSPWAEFFENNNPQFKHLFDFGLTGGFQNSRARQGVAGFLERNAGFCISRPRLVSKTAVFANNHA